MCTVLLMDLGRNEVGRIEKLAHKASIARTIGKTIYLLTMILRVAATSLSTEKPSGGGRRNSSLIDHVRLTPPIMRFLITRGANVYLHKEKNRIRILLEFRSVSTDKQVPATCSQCEFDYC